MQETTVFHWYFRL